MPRALAYASRSDLWIAILGFMKTLALVLLVAFGSGLWAGETLPAGPPWERDFMKAHASALEAGKPIFLYFTKTY